jgi:hypothetical protein
MSEATTDNNGQSAMADSRALVPALPSRLDGTQQGKVLGSKHSGEELVQLWQSEWGVVCSFAVEDEEGMIAMSALLAGSDSLLNDMPHGDEFVCDGIAVCPVEANDRQSGELTRWIRVAMLVGGKVITCSSDHVRRAIGVIVTGYKGLLPPRTKWRVVKTKCGQPTPMLNLAYLGRVDPPKKAK